MTGSVGQSIRYSLNTLSKELTITGAGSTVVVRNFKAGDLGITVPAADHTGRGRPAIHLRPGNQRGPERVALLTPEQRNANLRLDNAVFADGSYLGVSGLPAHDTITGGAAVAPSGTILNGGAGDDHLWAGLEGSGLQAAIDAGESNASATGSATLMLAGNEGDDQLVGGRRRRRTLRRHRRRHPGRRGRQPTSSWPTATTPATKAATPSTAWSSGSNTTKAPGAGCACACTARASAHRHRQHRAAHRHRAPHRPEHQPLADTDLSGLLAMRAQDIVPEPGDTHIYLPDTQLTYAQVNGGKAMGTNIGSGADIVYAGAGDDIVNAGAGDDIVFAGSGLDAVAGYEGDDFIEGGEDADILWGDFTAHNPYAAQESYTQFGATWTIRLELDPARHGRDYIDGGRGNDSIYGAARPTNSMAAPVQT